MSSPWRRTIGADITVEGLPQLKRAFQILPKRVLHKVMRQSNTNAMTPALKAARDWTRIVRKDSTGAYKKSLTKKTKTYSKTSTVFSIVGAKSDYFFKGRRPNKYAHLLEKGHRLAPRTSGAKLDRWRRVKDSQGHYTKKKFEKGNSAAIGFVQAYPVIGSAYNQTSQVVTSKWKSEFAWRFDKEARILGLRP